MFGISTYAHHHRSSSSILSRSPPSPSSNYQPKFLNIASNSTRELHTVTERVVPDYERLASEVETAQSDYESIASDGRPISVNERKEQSNTK